MGENGKARTVKNICGCTIKRWDGLLYFCPLCGGRLQNTTTFTAYGYSMPEIKKIIDFAKQHGYKDKE